MTLVPALAQLGAAHVTMLQRTPSYVFGQPGVDPFVQALRKRLSPQAVQKAARVKNLGMQYFLYELSRWRPKAANKIALTELRSADSAGLEEMFLELTAESQREGAAA